MIAMPPVPCQRNGKRAGAMAVPVPAYRAGAALPANALADQHGQEFLLSPGTFPGIARLAQQLQVAVRIRPAPGARDNVVQRQVPQPEMHITAVAKPLLLAVQGAANVPAGRRRDGRRVQRRRDVPTAPVGAVRFRLLCGWLAPGIPASGR